MGINDVGYIPLSAEQHRQSETIRAKKATPNCNLHSSTRLSLLFFPWGFQSDKVTTKNCEYGIGHGLAGGIQRRCPSFVQCQVVSAIRHGRNTYEHITTYVDLYNSILLTRPFDSMELPYLTMLIFVIVFLTCPLHRITTSINLQIRRSVLNTLRRWNFHTENVHDRRSILNTPSWWNYYIGQ